MPTAPATMPAYVPIVTTVSNTGDEIVAFAAQMVYYPSQGSNSVVNWGANHEYRVIWMVQMITDYCIEGLDEDGDCQGDGERDVTLANLSSKIDEWATDEGNNNQ